MRLNQPSTSIFGSQSLVFENGSYFQPSENQNRMNDHAVISKKQYMRCAVRYNHIDNYKRSIRFKLDLQNISQLPRSNQIADSQQIIAQAIMSKNIQRLVNLTANSIQLVKAALANYLNQLMDLIQDKIQCPLSILLLGNLCSIQKQFIKASNSRKLISKFINLMNVMKSNTQSCQIICWCLTQISRETHLLDQQQLESGIIQLYPIFDIAFKSKQVSSHLCTHLCRLIAYFTIVVRLPDSFLNYLLDIQPTRNVDKLNFFLALRNHVNKLQYTQNQNLTIKLINYLIWLFPQINQQLQKSIRKTELYNLLQKILLKTQYQVSQYMLKQNIKFINQYKYGNKKYLSMLFQIFVKCCNFSEYLQSLRVQNLIQNLINDISDGNTQIGYLCLKIVRIILQCCLSAGQIQFIEWVTSLNLDNQIQQFINNSYNNKKMLQLAELVKSMIKMQ